MCSKQARKAMGATPPWVWTDEYASLHPPADPLSMVDGEQEQTYRMFMDMLKREPNERGTGRWKLTPDKRTIALVALDDVAIEQIRKVQRYLQAFYYELPVEHYSSKASLIRNKNKLMLQSSTSKYKLQSLKVNGEDHVEVFSVFDALTHFLQPHHYCIIALTNHPLCEADDIGGATAVLGRACGDRVCVVDTNCKLITLLATVTHESLHCFGLDHCTTFRCLMNSQSIENEDCLFLSPLNVKKWITGVLGYRDSEKATTVVLERYGAMKKVLNEFGLDEEVKWLEQKMDAVLHATNRKRRRSERE